MELQERFDSALRAAVDFSRGRRISKTKQQTDHQIFPQKREELPDHRTRIGSLKKSGRLCLRQDAVQRCAAGLATDDIERARHLRRASILSDRKSKHADDLRMAYIAQKNRSKAGEG